MNFINVKYSLGEIVEYKVNVLDDESYFGKIEVVESRLVKGNVKSKYRLSNGVTTDDNHVVGRYVFLKEVR